MTKYHHSRLSPSIEDLHLPTRHNISKSVNEGSYMVAFIDSLDSLTHDIFQGFLYINNLRKDANTLAVKQHRSDIPNWILVTGGDPDPTHQAPVAVHKSLRNDVISLFSRSARAVETCTYHSPSS